MIYTMYMCVCYVQYIYMYMHVIMYMYMYICTCSLTMYLRWLDFRVSLLCETYMYYRSINPCQSHWLL